MSELDMKVIRARVNAATHGPWGSFSYSEDDEALWPEECDVQAIDNSGTTWVFGSFGGGCKGEKDSEFIAHARQDVPALLDRVIR
jgi:hypothetical protein